MAGFYGWRVVGAAFVLAFFGWGLGFYGPPVYLHAVREARGFSLSVVSAAVTVHFLRRRACRRQHADALPPVRTAGRDQSRGDRARRRRVRLGRRRHAVAACSPRRFGQRRRLGRDERRRRQRGGLAVVCARATGGARHRLQRRELCRVDPLAAMGDGHSVCGFSGWLPRSSAWRRSSSRGGSRAATFRVRRPRCRSRRMATRPARLRPR